MLDHQKAQTVITALKHLFAILKRQYNIEPKVLWRPTMKVQIKSEVKVYVPRYLITSIATPRSLSPSCLTKKENVIIEPSAPWVYQFTNRRSQRSGGVVKDKIRKRQNCQWPEMSRAGVYPIYIALDNPLISDPTTSTFGPRVLLTDYVWNIC
jgi:hypothetical protein